MRTHLSAAVRHWGRFSPKRLAIEAEAPISYFQLDSAAEYVKAMLCSKPSTPSRIVVAVKNQALLVAAIIGCSRAQKSYILVDPNDIWRYVVELRTSCSDPYIISDQAISGAKAPVISISPEAYSFADFEYQQYDVDPTSEAAIIFTSGTTGRPKGVIRTNFSLLSEGILWIVELKITQDTRFMISRPLYWTGGFVFMYATLFCGGTLLVSEGNDEIALVTRAQVNPVNVAFMVPSQLHNLIRHPAPRRPPFAGKVVTMGGPISADAKVAFSKLYQCDVIEAWGNSEGLGTITCSSDLHARPSSIGRPCFCDSLEIIDSLGRQCESGEPGLLVGHSDNQYDHYLHESEPQNGPDQKLIPSGDIGYKDAEGFFYLLGRASERVTIDGEDIFPSFIEKTAMASDLIKDIAIVVDSEKDRNSFLVALLVPRGPETPEVLLAWLNSKLPSSHHVRRAIQVEAIPRNEAGKTSMDGIQRLYREASKCSGTTPIGNKQ